MKIEERKLDNTTKRLAGDIPPTKPTHKESVLNESDLYSFSDKALSLHDGNSSFTDRPVIIIEIKPSPP